MSDPSNPGDWQQVPSTPSDPAAPAGGYPPPNQGYPPPPGGYPPPPPSYPPPQAGYPPQPVPPQSAPMSPTSVAAIAYLTFIPAVIFLLLEPYKRIPFVRFHCIQSIALNVVGFAIGLVFAVLLLPMHMIGVGLLMHLVHLCIDLLLFVAWLMCIIQASQGKWFKLPLLGDFALKQSGQ